MNMVFFDYCSLIAFREVFFVTKGHKKTRDLRREIMCIAKRVAVNGVNSNILCGSLLHRRRLSNVSMQKGTKGMSLTPLLYSYFHSILRDFAPQFSGFS